MSTPSTPLSTHFSGPARDTRRRLLNLFQDGRRRPPVPLALLLLCAIALCGSLVACQSGEADAVSTPETSAQQGSAPELRSCASVLVQPLAVDDLWAERPEEGGAVPGNVLRYLLPRSLVEEYDACDKFHTELIQAGEGQTLALVSFSGPEGSRCYVLGAVDNATWQPTGPCFVARWDFGGFTTWTGEDGALYLLWSGGSLDRIYGPECFRYDGTALERVTSLPDALRESWAALYGAETPLPADLLTAGCDFWTTHTAAPLFDGVVDIYRAVGDGSAQRWELEGHVRFH
jgi:hypothetical protein